MWCAFFLVFIYFPSMLYISDVYTSFEFSMEKFETDC